MLLWGRESVVVSTCMQGERALRVVVGTGSDGVVGWARAIRHAIRQNQTCKTYSDALRRDDQTHLERRRSRVGEQHERESLDGGT